jgi:hypothetical protein
LNKETVSSIATKIKKLSERADSIPTALDSSRNISTKQAQTRDECSDEYCIEHHIEPPRFAYYKQVRLQSHPNPLDFYDYRRTSDELDYDLKCKLHPSPEERYQDYKEGWEWHPSNMDGKHDNFNGCSNLQCIPGCRYAEPYGRVEDSEVIAEHNEFVEYCRQQNWIMEIPLPDNWYELIRKK